MNTLEAIESRHSVRDYTDERLSDAACAALQREIDLCNEEGHLHMQLVVDEPQAFTSGRARYGSFSGVRNYIAVVGEHTPDLQERAGYYGERLVLAAQKMGLNTCWVALTFKRVPDAFSVDSGEKLVCLITVGHGTTSGEPHRIKTAPEVSNWTTASPDWFKAGVTAALLAPTAMNQQKFTLTREGTVVTAKAGVGFYTKLDLGIVKYNFEVAAGRENFRWASDIARPKNASRYTEVKA